MVKFRTQKPVETQQGANTTGGTSKTVKSRRKSNVESTQQLHGTAELHSTDQVSREGGQGHPDGKRLERQVYERALEIGTGYYGTDTGAFDLTSLGATKDQIPLADHQIKSTANKWRREMPQLGNDAEALVRDLAVVLSAA